MSQMGGPPGISWVEANDAAKHCTPKIKNAPASDVNNTKVRNLISAAGWQPWQHPTGSQQNIPGDSVCFPKTLFSLLKSFFLLLPGNVFIIRCHSAKCLQCLTISPIQLSYTLVAAEQINGGGGRGWETAAGKKIHDRALKSDHRMYMPEMWISVLDSLSHHQAHITLQSS